MLSEFLGIFLSFFYRVLATTYRYQVVFEDERDRKLLFNDLEHTEAHNNNLLYAFFHQKELSLISFFIDRKIMALVSQSQDGEIMTQTLKRLGYRVARGSSSRRSIAGFIECLKAAKKGYSISMAVDGPKGPIYKVKDGIPKLCEKTGKKIVPLGAQAHSFYLFEKAWNQAQFPFPFSKIDVQIGKIQHYTKKELEKKLKEQL